MPVNIGHIPIDLIRIKAKSSWIKIQYEFRCKRVFRRPAVWGADFKSIPAGPNLSPWVITATL
jgi:hypothetical protein